ncbi:MAG: methyltransferase domain-containing protein [Acidimicrobiia bacterium]
MTISRDLIHADEIDAVVGAAYRALESPTGAATWLYTQDQLEWLPEGARMWALGVGNPVPYAELAAGESVLDLGCGAGIDVLLAARAVGPDGRSTGLDSLPEMVDRATVFAAEAGIDWVEFIEGRMEAIPLPDESVDVVISNGTINLAARKSRVLAEAFRVLRPGGRLCVADLTIVEEDLPPEILTHPSAWAG